MMVLTYMLVLTCIYGVRSECPFGWVIGNRSCYLFHQVKLSLTVASHYCRSLEGHLARVESQQEQNLIHEVLNHLPGDYWLE
ncbi:Hypothetical predicted protein [Mytilus galloprovincialis]|uniref:C-type lectin domain-containing protein n=1 Tax=Mytilus galloprovincialis TaxID=29158 RepID=A0A8B6FM29_MYTGA|nr:Hypothetical predicted protein [Mytilus galloprovincialis]